MPAKQKLRAPLIALAVLSVTVLGVPTAFAGDAHYEGISADGGVAVFSTEDSLVPGDTDFQRDVYVRDSEEGLGYVTREASLGPAGGNDAYPAQFQAIDPAGEEVFFSTKERLTAADTDSAEDVYVRNLGDNETTLVSAGDVSCSASGCGNANADASAAPGGFVDDGTKVFLVSGERLSSEDTDNRADVYVRDLLAERTKLVSVADPSCTGSCGSGAKLVVFQGASSDGSEAIFTTAESLTAQDVDAESDLYERDLQGAGDTNLVSKPAAGPEACPSGKTCEPATSSISSDGTHVFFETNERISVADGDKFQDVYDWTGGTPSLASVGPTGGNGEFIARYGGSSADGARLFFKTEEQLQAADGDAGLDVYVRTDGIDTELVSERAPSCMPSVCGGGSEPAEVEWVSPSGAIVVFSSEESLTIEDEDESFDAYARALPGGPTTLVSRPGPTCSAPTCGNGDADASFAEASSDGFHLFFVTEEALAPPEPVDDPFAFGDSDGQTDVYERSAGTTTLVSLGQVAEDNVFRGNGDFPAQLRAVSATGAPAFFTTKEQLTEADTDAGEDIYLRLGGSTVLVSRGNDAAQEAALAPPAPTLERTDPESPNAATALRVIGSESVEASIKLYATANCNGEPVATGSAAELEEPGLAVTVDAGTTTTFRAIAEANGFVSPCSGVGISYTQHGTSSSGGGSGSGSGGGASAQSPIASKAPALQVRGPVQYLTPQTRITFGPAFKTRARRPVFRFTDTTGQEGTRFACKLDRLHWRPCSSPTQLRKVGRGKHLFRVKGVNAGGVWEAHPTRRAFKLVRR